MPGHVLDQPRAGLDVGVELAGDDAGHVERGRAELEACAPPTDEASIRSPSTSTSRPRRAAAEAVGPEHPVDPLVARQQHRRSLDHARRRARRGTPRPTGSPPRSRRSRRPSSARRRSGAAATDTQHDSSPASAGRVPSIGSTTSTVRALPAGLDQPAVLRVEGHVRAPARRGTPRARARPRRRWRTSRRRRRPRGLVRPRRRASPSCGSTRSRSARARSRTSSRIGLRARCPPGRLPSSTSTVRRLPSRNSSSRTLVAGAVRADLVGQVVLARERLCRPRPRSRRRPTAMSVWPWKVIVSSPAWMPGVLGRAAVHHVLRPARPVSTSRPSRSASCGQIVSVSTPR